MNVQIIIVAAIGILVAGIIVRKAYRFFSDKDPSSHCPGCSGCEPYRKQRLNKS